MTFLYDILLQEFGKRAMAQVDVPNHVTDNLKFSQRPYQIEAFQRFILCHSEVFEGKPNKPYHLLIFHEIDTDASLRDANVVSTNFHSTERNIPDGM